MAALNMPVAVGPPPLAAALIAPPTLGNPSCSDGVHCGTEDLATVSLSRSGELCLADDEMNGPDTGTGGATEFDTAREASVHSPESTGRPAEATDPGASSVAAQPSHLQARELVLSPLPPPHAGDLGLLPSEIWNVDAMLAVPSQQDLQATLLAAKKPLAGLEEGNNLMASGR